VKRQWEIKASLRYSDFISRIKKNGTNPGYVTDIVWENWMRLWQAPENVAKSETNKKNRRGGREAAIGTHTSGSISIGEHRKKLVSIYFTQYIFFDKIHFPYLLVITKSL